MTAIGKMRKRVAIYTRADSEAGEFSASIARTLLKTVWAQVVNVTGTAQVDSRNAGTGITHRITIRDRSDISKTNEILYDGWLYRIETMQRANDERERFLILECNQIAQDNTLRDVSPILATYIVSGTSSAFDGDYIYDATVSKWLLGETHSLYKDTIWYLTDGTTTFTAPDNGLDTPPTTFERIA